MRKDKFINAPTKPGDSIYEPITAQQKKFLNERFYSVAGNIDRDDVLTHFAATWFELCQWERQRVAVIDAKAQGLLGGSSVASALSAVGIGGIGDPLWGGVLFLAPVVLFAISAWFAVRTMSARDFGGFLDTDIFGALDLYRTGIDPSAKHDPDQFRCYLRDLAVQRWLVYTTYRRHAEGKLANLRCGTSTLFLAIVMLVVALASQVISVSIK